MDRQSTGLAALPGLMREKPLVLVAWLFAFALVYQFASNDIHYVLAHGAWQASPGTLVGRDFVNMFSAGHCRLNIEVVEHRQHERNELAEEGDELIAADR